MSHLVSQPGTAHSCSVFGRFATILAVALGVAAGCSDASPKTPQTKWTPCHDTFECTTVEVPVDYDAPAGPTIALSVIRAPATNPDARLGSIIVNPGGPGVPMVARLVAQYGTLRFAFQRAFERFDVVAFDWRGVGGSAPLHCVSDANLDALRAAPLTLEKAEDEAELDRVKKALTDGCSAAAGARMLESVNTENAAADLDRVREAVGDPKLTFLGLSYGTWLGATYATRFPNRVRALVLDSPALLPEDNLAQIERRAHTLDGALERFFAACGPDAKCAFHGGQGPDAVARAFDALMSRIVRGEVAGGPHALSVVDAALGVTSSLRDADRSPLATSLSKAENGDGSALRVSADAAAGKRADGTYDGAFEGLLAIGSLDLPVSATTTTAMRTFMDDLRSRSRSARSAAIPWSLSVGWPWHRHGQRLAISAKTAPPLMIVATRYDPLAVYDDGAALAAALGNGSPVVTYEGDGHIAILHSDCVRNLATDYLLDPSVPLRTTTCSN